MTELQSDYFERRMIEIERFDRRRPFTEKCPQSRHYVGGAVAVPDRTARRFKRTLDVRWIAGKHSEAGAGVGDDARQRLIDFVSNRRRKRPKAHDPRHMGELRSRAVECLL